MSKLDFLAKYAVADRHYNSHDEIDKALDHPHWTIRQSAIQHLNATKEHIDKALNDVDYVVRAAAIKRHIVTKEQIDKALSDENCMVRYFGMRYNHPVSVDITSN